MTWVHGEEEIMSHKPFVFSNASLLYTSITHEAHNQKPSEAGRALQTCTGASEELKTHQPNQQKRSRTGISGNFVGRIKGAKCPFDLQFLTWDFS